MPRYDDQLVRLYDTVYDRAPDDGGRAFWNAHLDAGVPLTAIAGGFMQAPEFAATYGQPTSRSFVESLYENILDRPGEADGIRFWTDALEQGRAQRADIVVGFSDSPEHVMQMQLSASAPAPTEAAAPEPGSQHVPSTLPFDKGGPWLRMKGSEYDDVMEGGDGDDEAWGYLGNDTARGHGGDDFLYGDRGDDVLYGGEGNDTLVGGPGEDHLYGGPGADVFRYGSVAEVDAYPLRDFQPGSDKLDFRDAGLLFRAAGPFDTHPMGGAGKAQLRYEYDASVATQMQWKTGVVTQIHIDADGNGAADLSMSVVGVALNNDDFLV